MSGGITTYKPGPLNPFRDSASLKVEVSFADNYNAVSPTYVDLTGRIRFASGISWSRGRNDEWAEVSPGQFTITFNNFDRFLDPSFSGSPYWPHVDWGRPMRITAYYAGVTYIQFVGVVEEWECSWTPGGDAICTATGTEVLGILAWAELIAYGSPTLTASTRLAALCTTAGIASSKQDFINGPYNIQAQDYTKTDILTACQEVAAGMNQIFFTSRDGIFRNRNQFLAFDSDLGTFGENPGEIHAASTLAPSIGGAYSFSMVRFQCATPQNAQAPTPPTSAPVPIVVGQPGGGGKARYGTRTFSRNGPALAFPDAQSLATLVAAAISTKQGPRIKAATLFPMRDPTHAWPAVLDADIGNTCTFKYSPPGGGPRFSQASVVRSVAHSVTSSNWTSTWNLSP